MRGRKQEPKTQAIDLPGIRGQDDDSEPKHNDVDDRERERMKREEEDGPQHIEQQLMTKVKNQRRVPGFCGNDSTRKSATAIRK